MKAEQRLDNILQVGLPDDYYEDIRKLIIPRLLKWSTNEYAKGYRRGLKEGYKDGLLVDKSGL